MNKTMATTADSLLTPTNIVDQPKDNCTKGLNDTLVLISKYYPKWG
ncbi:hypothetical protein X975_03982, partial [Stegodyphus mimosarum]